MKPSALSMRTSTPSATSTSSAVRKAGSERACVSRPMNSGPRMPCVAAVGADGRRGGHDVGLVERGPSARSRDAPTCRRRPADRAPAHQVAARSRPRARPRGPRAWPGRPAGQPARSSSRNPPMPDGRPTQAAARVCPGSARTPRRVSPSAAGALPNRTPRGWPTGVSCGVPGAGWMVPRIMHQEGTIG